MTGWIVLGIAFAGYLVCYRVVYSALGNNDLFGGDDSLGKALTVSMAMLISFFWPLVLLGFAFWLFATPTTVRERREQVRQMEKRRQQLQEDIAQLERETKGDEYR